MPDCSDAEASDAAGGKRGVRWRPSGDVSLMASVVVGLTVGWLVFVLEWLATESLDEVRRLPWWAASLAPGVGLVAAAVVLRLGPVPRSRSTADEYLQAMHDPTRRVSGRQVLTRLVGALATVGLGGALGLEGPAVLLGAGVGGGVARRFEDSEDGESPVWLTGGSVATAGRQAMLVAGAAAGVAAVFKAPATGAIFALEVPYRSDLARHQLFPALVGAASGYLALTMLAGTDRLFPVSDSPPFDLRDLGGAVVLGLVAGVVARGVALGIRWAKHRAADVKAPVRIPLAAGACALASAAAYSLTGQPIGIGPGHKVLEWIADPGVGLAVVLAVFVLRLIVTLATTAGGGIGGFFIPLVVLGGLLGRIASSLTHTTSSMLFPILGVAALLGAGYQVPLAAVMFVAESSGRPGYVVPALFAAVVADLASGGRSVTDFQRDRAD